MTGQNFNGKNDNKLQRKQAKMTTSCDGNRQTFQRRLTSLNLRFCRSLASKSLKSFLGSLKFQRKKTKSSVWRFFFFSSFFSDECRWRQKMTDFKDSFLHSNKKIFLILKSWEKLGWTKTFFVAAPPTTNKENKLFCFLRTSPLS